MGGTSLTAGSTFAEGERNPEAPLNNATKGSIVGAEGP